MIRSAKILRSAQGEDCTVHSPWCNGNPATTVWAHSDSLVHGKGRSVKAHDLFGCYSCSGCHDWLHKMPDGKIVRDMAFQAAMARSQLKLVEKGLLRVA